MQTALLNARVLTDAGLESGLAVVIESGRIADVARANRLPDCECVDLEGGVLAPGFIDVQVNGGGGVLFNDAPSKETIAQIGAAHRRFGTTGFLPTLISDNLDVVAKAMTAVDAAIEAGVPGVLGVHIEGPFLNPERSGVHDAAKMRELDDAAFALLTSLKRGRTLVTLAPEMTTPEMISRLAAAGVIVSAGHTNATYEQTREAIAAGLTGFTHLFNAMSPLLARAPGVVGAALDDQDTWASVICDGVHIAPPALRIAFRAKRHERLMLVTDAMPSVGANEKIFKLQGKTIRVLNGVCIDESGTLAGADLDMASAVRTVVAETDVRPHEALRMAASTAADFLGLSNVTGRIAPGLRADLVHLDDELRVRRTWIGGAPSV
ncbi:MAG TPA: N-acetylglucosamine-6-phosphate deacetylase [Caulobacterales bacterium]|nr:N-acetylglucosamine-6-phosphate deacetylase [Caulobacterales bacterium]